MRLPVILGCLFGWVRISTVGASLAIFASCALAQRFDFGPGPVQSGWQQVAPGRVYTPEAGFGFEPGAADSGLSRPRSNSMTSDLRSNGQPFLFSVRLPERNYDVEVILGDPSAGSTNTIKAESRRLMIEDVQTSAGQFATSYFTVNIRTPCINEGDSVRLKPRENGVLHWDDKLTLEFNGSRPALCRLEVRPAPEATTLFLLGDSTVTDQPNEPWNSWGQMLTRFFAPGIAIANYAESGESLNSSLSAGRVRKVLTSLKPGDYVLVQFGHNDQKDKATNALAVFERNLGQLVEDVRSRRATIVLVTSMERMSGLEKNTLAGYPDAVRRMAKTRQLPMIDLQSMSRTLYRALGDNLARAFQDGTHHNAYGSYELARCVVEGLRESVPQISKYLRPDVERFDPASPDSWQTFRIPASPAFSSTKPDGN